MVMVPRVPRSAAVLGTLGLTPFVGLATGAAVSDDSLQAAMATALVAYGAVILSFLGGIQWGLALQHGGDGTPRAGLLCLSVVPSLAGWAALLLTSPSIGAGLLAGCFAAVFAIDAWLSMRGAAPSWYPRLRAPLTIIAATSLIVASLADVP